MKELKETGKRWRDCLLWGLPALLLGAVIGAVDAVFGRGLMAISKFRDGNLKYLLPFLAPAGLLITWLYTRFGRESGRGMGLIFAVGHGEKKEIPLRLVPLVFGSTWLTHLFGGSAGREGVAVQIGAALSYRAAARIFPSAGRIFLTAGMAAGFAGIFGTPIAATFFAVEVLYSGRIDFRALFPSFTAALAASFVSGLLGLKKFTADAGSLALNIPAVGKLILLGIIFGIAGQLFVYLQAAAKKYLKKFILNPYVRIGCTGILLTMLLFLLRDGRYCGLGTNLIAAALSGGEIYGYDWILKLLLTVLTLAAGYQGGEVTPLFSIGASLGAALAGIFGLPPELTASLGYAAVFGSASNTYFAPILIGAEIFGFSNLPLFFVVCTAARCFSSGRSIYTGQKTEA
ncbi:MAG: chloride channel protein [Candidatus Limivicinus sp.]|jgi:H+/Cl- antiporter ClcA